MPTFGWVMEDAWDAVLDQNDRRAERRPIGPLRPRYACPFCSMTLSSVGDLQAHIGGKHRMSRPVLSIDGREPATDGVQRLARPPSAFACMNTTAVDLVVDGLRLEVSPNGLANKLSDLQDADVDVALTNKGIRAAIPVQTRYRIRFRVAGSAELHGVEQAYAEHFLADGVSLSHVDAFLSDPRCCGVARDYAEAIASYVIGVLIRDQPHGQLITSRFSQYREKFVAALEVLGSYERPTALLVCAVMRFALNQFSGPGFASERLTGLADLDLAIAMMHGQGKASGVGKRATGPSKRVCVIDQGTQRILDLARRLSEQARWGPVLEEECRQVATAQVLDLSDKQKALALWATTALRLKAHAAALEPLTQLAAVYPFSGWAASCLEKVSK